MALRRGRRPKVSRPKIRLMRIRQKMILPRKIRPKIPGKADAPLAQLIRDCWAELPESRPEHTEILERLSKVQV